MNFFVKSIRKIGDLEFVKPYDDQLIDNQFLAFDKKNKQKTKN